MMRRFQHIFLLSFIALLLSHMQWICAEERENQDVSKEAASTVNSEPENPFAFPDHITPEDHFYSDFINMLTTLGMLIGLLLFVSWFLKRMMRTRSQHLNTSSAIKIIEQRSLSTKSMIHLIEIEGKYFAVGESHNNVVLIGEFPSLEIDKEPQNI